MRKALVIASGCIVLILAAFAWDQWMEVRSADALLNGIRSIRPHMTLAQVTQVLGPPDYTFEAPDFSPWLKASAVGDVKQGTVVVYVIKHTPPALLVIYLLPDSGVQFVTWEPT